MATMLQALQDCTYDNQNKRDLSGDFSKKLLSYRERVISDFLKYNTDLNKAISDIAKRENLNDDQIQRIVEEVNNQVYLIKYDKLKSSNDREVEFDIASVQKVKNLMTGNNSSEKSDDGKLKKAAFETTKLSDDFFEKVASDNSYDFLSGKIPVRYGDLSCRNKKDKDEFLINKIASNLDERKKSLDKIAECVSNLSKEIGETFVLLEKRAYDTNKIMSSLIKNAELTNTELGLLKEATSKELDDMKLNRKIPDFVKIEFDNINTEKTAFEKFNLGKFSLNKNASFDEDFDTVLLSSGKSINGMNGLIKIAKEYKENIETLCLKHKEYSDIKNKCASSGITDDMLTGEYFIMKNAGLIDDSISKLQRVASSNTVKNVVEPIKNTTKQITQNLGAGINQSPVKNTTAEITKNIGANINQPAVKNTTNELLQKNNQNMQKMFNKATRNNNSRIGSKAINNPIQQQGNISNLE